MNRFEERPLLWKAQYQFNQGKLDDAEQTIKIAIAIDPSDGEMGKNHRMRAYQIYGDILEKKGDQATAKIMRGVISAIRKSEAADDLWKAGLLSMAVKQYESALFDFADAYCIQSRLALRYSETGNHEKAEQHYMKAFELMPDSFGRIESHCFGCEGIFSRPQAQNAAEKVFTRLASQPGAKAQVHYLIGYLRSSQRRHQEALASYQKAIHIDPDYVNAHKQIIALGKKTSVSPEDLQNSELHLIQMNPYHIRSYSSHEHIYDFKRLWNILLKAEKDMPVLPNKVVFEFKASKEQIEKNKPSNHPTLHHYSYSHANINNDPSVRSTLLTCDVLKSIQDLIEMSPHMR